MNDLTKIKKQGTYSKTDIECYSELTSGNVKAALKYKNPADLYLIFNLIEEKDSRIGAEIEKRYSTLEGKFINHDAPPAFAESISEIVLASLDASMFGYGIVELYIDSNSNQFAFRRIEKEYFCFQNGKLFLKSNGNLFEPTEPRFIVFKRKPILSKLLWIIYAKHYVLSHYMKFTEFLGVPPILCNASSSEKDTISSIAKALQNIKSGSYAVLGKDDIVKVLEGRGSQSDFMEFVRYADNEISVCISGSVLSSNIGSSGSFAQAKIHEDNRYELVAKDARFAERCVVRCFSAINMAITILILVEKDQNLLQRAQVLQILQGLGYTMSPAQIAKEFDMPAPETVNNAIQNLSINQKENNSQNKTPIYLDRFDAGINSKDFKASLNSIAIEINNSLRSILANANSYEEAFNALLAEHPHIKMDILEDVMFRAVANSGLLGVSDV